MQVVPEKISVHGVLQDFILRHVPIDGMEQVAF